jgi:hypothetical protein
MRAFCHISEFNEFGYDILPSMILLSEKLVIWSPSGSQIEYFNNTNKTYFTRKNMLELIDEGYVQIIGRDSWISDIEFRNNHS